MKRGHERGMIPCPSDLMSLTREKAQLMSASEIDRTLVRLAHEILEKTSELDKLAFIGVRRRGVPLAQRLAKKIESLEKRAVPVGILDINLYRRCVARHRALSPPRHRAPGPRNHHRRPQGLSLIHI